MGKVVQEKTGTVYGHLTVVRRSGFQITPSGFRVATWLCKCDCGAQVIVRGSNLRYGSTKSCGHPRKISFQAIMCRRWIQRKRVHIPERYSEHFANDFREFFWGEAELPKVVEDDGGIGARAQLVLDGAYGGEFVVD